MGSFKTDLEYKQINFRYDTKMKVYPNQVQVIEILNQN
jgi:hypothetical protein